MNPASPLPGCDTGRKSLPGLGVDVQGLIRTPYGEFNRIEVGTDDGMPLPGEVLLQVSRLGQPLPEGLGKRVTIFEETAKGAVILSTPEPCHANSHASQSEQPAPFGQPAAPTHREPILDRVR